MFRIQESVWVAIESHHYRGKLMLFGGRAQCANKFLVPQVQAIKLANGYGT
jgi:hypothetical protein